MVVLLFMNVTRVCTWQYRFGTDLYTHTAHVPQLLRSSHRATQALTMGCSSARPVVVASSGRSTRPVVEPVTRAQQVQAGGGRRERGRAAAAAPAATSGSNRKSEPRPTLPLSRVYHPRGGEGVAGPLRGSPLHKAALDGDVELVKALLLDKDVDVDVMDWEGDTALHRAAWRCNVAVATLLLIAGADASHANFDGWTPLHTVGVVAYGVGAKEKVQLPFAWLLLAAGADVDAATKSEKTTPLHIAVCSSTHSPEFVALLVSRSRAINAANYRGSTPLHGARYVADVGALLEAGADVNAVGCWGWTPLHLATRYPCDARVLALLVDAGADVNARTPQDGGTCLHLAASCDFRRCVAEELLALGAHVNATNANGETPLHLMAQRRKYTSPAEDPYRRAEPLLRTGAAVDALDGSGRTALQVAYEHRLTFCGS